MALFEQQDAIQIADDFYLRNVKKLKEALLDKTGRCLADLLTRDYELTCFMVLSPSHLVHLSRSLDNPTALRRALIISNGIPSDVALIISAAFSGVKMNFGESTLEKGWMNMMMYLTQILQEQNNETTMELRRSISAVATILASQKNRALHYEKQLMLLSQDQFDVEYGLRGLFVSRLSNIVRFNSKQELQDLITSYPWASRTSGNPARIMKIFMPMYVLLMYLYQVLQYCLPSVVALFNVCAYIWGGLSFLNFAFVIFRVLASRHFGSNYNRYLISVALALLFIVIHYLRTTKTRTLQAKGEKRFIGAMAFCALGLYMFDADLADIMSSSLSKVSRIAGMLVDEDRGFMNKAFELQMENGESSGTHDISEDEISDEINDENAHRKGKGVVDHGLISTITSVALSVIENDQDDLEKVKSNSSGDGTTFLDWVNINRSCSKTFYRPIQYGCKKTFALNPENAMELAQEMKNVDTHWSQVVGHTGSGKSTRLPVAYLNAISETSGRIPRILICEPTKAATVNVCHGVARNYGKAVYGKHENWEQLGDNSICVMTYGSAMYRQMNDDTFIKSFDTIFLDESHNISEHSMVFEAMCQKYRDVRKFYMSATPRDGSKCPEARRRFPITTKKTANVDTYVWMKEQGNGQMSDVTMHDTILVFMAGTNECDTLALKWNSTIRTGHKAYSLHSKNFAENYTTIVSAMENGKVVVFCTNVLETGVTLNVDCVVEFGHTMRPKLDLVEKKLSLIKTRVTENERQQRIGRAGRLKDGFALVCGKTEVEENIISPDTLYGAALLSFVCNVDLFVDGNFEASWMNGITRTQAKVMTQFNLSPFLMRDIVDKDGAIPQSLIPIIKKSAQRTSEIESKSTLHSPESYNTWPRYHKHHLEANRGAPCPVALSTAKIPFIIPHCKTIDWELFAEEALKFRKTTPFHFETVHPSKRTVIFSVDKYNILSSHAAATELLERTKNSIQGKQSTLQNFSDNLFLIKMGMSRPQKRLREEIKLLEHNEQVLISVIRRMEAEISSPGQFVCSDEAEMKVKRIFELQMEGELTGAKLMETLELSHYPRTLQDVFIANTFKIVISLAIFILVSLIAHILIPRFLKKKKKETEVEKRVGNYTLEGKGKAYNRSKRMDIPQEEKDRAEEFHERVQARSSRLSSRRHTGNEIRTKKAPFYHFYDLTTDADVIEAIFSTTYGDEFHRTQTPVADAPKLHKKLEKFLEENPIPPHLDTILDAGDETDHITCVLKTTRGVFKVNMAPHKSRMNGRITMNEAGFHEHHGQFRQSGATLFVSASGTTRELEGAGQIPLTRLTEDSSSCVGVIKNGKRSVNCIIYKDWIVAPAHAQMMEGEITITFKHATYTTTTEAIDNTKVVRFAGSDIILFQKPNAIRNIRSRLYAECIIRPGTMIQMIYMDANNSHVWSNSAQAYPTQFQDGSMTGRWAHQISTFNGMCGCAVVNNSQGSLIGIHVGRDHTAGKNEFQAFNEDIVRCMNARSSDIFVQKGIWRFEPSDYGYHEDYIIQCDPQCYRKDLEVWGIEGPNNKYIQGLNLAINGFGFNLKGKLVHQSDASDVMRFMSTFPKTSFDLVGTMGNHLISTHTFVGESEYFTKFMEMNPQFSWVMELMDDYAPSELTMEAYMKDLLKFDRPIRSDLTYDAEILNHAKNYLIKHLEEAGMEKCTVMSASDVLRDLQWGTSAGAAYSGKKREVLEHLSDSQLIEFADICHDRFFHDKIHGVWNGSLKAELRPIEKVQQHKTRVFTAAPLTSLIAMKFYVDDFNKKFYGTHLKAYHTVGINKFNRGWEALYEKLNKPGWLHGSGDGSRFDSSLDPFLFDAIKSVRNHFLDGCSQQIDTIYDEILNTPISLANGLVVRKHIGNNTGQPSTVVDNTLVLMLCFFYAYAKKTSDITFEKLKERFVFVCNGDDNKFAVSPEFVENFGHDFSKEMASLGLTYEFDEITDDICLNPYMSLTMVRTDFGIGFSLAQERIVAILQWGKKDGLIMSYLSAIAALVEAFNTPRLFMLINAYLHWLILEYEDELLALMAIRESYTNTPTPFDVLLLHYHEKEKTIFNLQMDEGNTSEDGEGQLANTNTGETVFKLPNFAGSKISNKAKEKIPYSLMMSAPKNTFDHNNTIVTTTQFKKWVTNVKSDLKITAEDEWASVVLNWCMWCANNGTSENTDINQKMEVRDDLGNTFDIPIEPFVVRAKECGGLRQVMRHYSYDTRRAIAISGKATKWGEKAGLVRFPWAACGFDFFVAEPGMSVEGLNVYKQARLAALGTGTRNSLITADKTNFIKSNNVRINDYDGHDDLLG